MCNQGFAQIIRDGVKNAKAESAIEQIQPPFCLILIVTPPIEILALRLPPEVLGATENVTVDVPEPVAVDVKLIQLASVVACHPHRDSAFMLIVPLPPSALNFLDEGVALYEQLASTPASCEIVTLRPAMLRVA